MIYIFAFYNTKILKKHQHIGVNVYFFLIRVYDFIKESLCKTCTICFQSGYFHLFFVIKHNTEILTDALVLI